MKREIALVARSLDAYRPITIVNFKNWDVELVAQYYDVVCINRYYGWYDNAGQLDLITYQIVNEVTAWWQRFGKPVIITEYGADTYVGLHQVPIYLFCFLSIHLFLILKLLH